ncbi:MAG: hypothetical protein WC869_03695 [Phycisphaerae bacterium]|jgi:rod shape-determining protein MreD
MRWIPFVILVYLVILIQTTLGRVLTFSGGGLGMIGPDLAAIVAVFIALRLRDGTEVAIAAWTLGLAVDLTTPGGVGLVTAVGPMSLGYCLAVSAVYRTRDAFFRERPASQAMLTLMFCLIAHALWVSLQTVFAQGVTRSWGNYGEALVQAMLLSAYTAVLAPLGCWVLTRCERILIPVQAGRARRGRGRTW